MLFAYLVGAIPFGYLIGRAKGVDIRAHGSGNIGATNVRRVLGRGPGNLCFALDVLKGAGPVLASGVLLGPIGAASVATGDALGWVGVAVMTVMGHMFPVYLRFKGGKGVATGLGALAALWPFVTPAAALALGLWVVTVRTTRYVSVASCVAACSLPVGVALARALNWPAASADPLAQRLADAWPFLGLTLLLAVLVTVKHKGNLARVRAGTEPKIGAGRREAEGATPG